MKWGQLDWHGREAELGNSHFQDIQYDNMNYRRTNTKCYTCLEFFNVNRMLLL